MKGFSKWLCFAILFSVVMGCSKKEAEKATITIKSSTQHQAKVTISRLTYLNRTELLTSQTDSTGLCSIEIPVEKPIFVLLQIGEKYGELYLYPGVSMEIKENGQAYGIPLTFSGEGAEINNYVSWINSNVEKIKWANGRGLDALNDQEFLHRFDSLKTTINDYHKYYQDSVSLPDEIASMLAYKNSIKFSEVVQEYEFLRLNNQLNQKWEAFRNEKNYMAGTITKELEQMTNNIPFDTTLLANGYGDYDMLLNFYWRNKIDFVIDDKLVGAHDSTMKKAPLMSSELIRKGDFPEQMREFLLAFDLQYWLASTGITPETNFVLTNFRNSYPNSNYLTVLNKIYQEWLDVAPGKPAPEFEGLTLDGKKVSIKDLRGKIVYMDVWATWCGPCVGEIPASKKLQERFKNEGRIQFLNVSVDYRKPDWEKFLNDDKTWKGLHLIIEPDKIQSLYKTYKLMGVPDYILIDQAGNIVNMKAPRPSDKDVVSEIEQLLANVK